MVKSGLVIAIVLLTASCGGSSSNARTSPSPSRASSSHSPSTSSPTSLTASPSSAPLPTGPFGLLIAGGKLELIDIRGAVVVSTAITQSSASACAGGGAALEAPPVSATSDLVYFRDGDTRIRSLARDGKTADVTTVPGGSSTVSFFSVSPDDKKIAVVVEDLSADPVKIRLYVEDLVGGGNHADIYSATAGAKGLTLWPMGWHGTSLVLAVWPVCAFEGGRLPVEWHVSDSVTAARLATIGSSSCQVGSFPSPAGVVCIRYPTKPAQATVYDWSGNAVSTGAVPDIGWDSGLAPSGGRLYTIPAFAPGAPPPETDVITIAGGTATQSFPGHSACGWIDDSHILAPDAVLDLPSGGIRALATPGTCAGRFPGGL